MLLDCTNPSPSLQVVELGRGPLQQILHDAAEAGQQHAGRGDALEQVVGRGDAAVGVAGRTGEAEKRCREVPVDGKPRARDGAGAQRALVGPLVRALQAAGVALELFDHGEQVMSDRGRLRALGVGVHGEDRFAMAIDELEQRLAAARGSPTGARGSAPAAASGTSSCRCRCGCGPCGAGRRPLRRTPAREGPRRRRTDPRRSRRRTRSARRAATRCRAPGAARRASGGETMPRSASITRWA